MSPSESTNDPFHSRHLLNTALGERAVWRLDALSKAGLGGTSKIDGLPYCIKVLLESLLRHVDGHVVTQDDVQALAAYAVADQGQREIPFMPGRVVLQDFTGVPAVVDLAAMRAAMHRMTGDPPKPRKLIPWCPATS